jgi:HSP20 family protein
MTGLIPWNLHQELSNWHRDIDDLFRRFLAGDGDQPNYESVSGWVPAMEAFEKDGQYVIRADLPGVDPKDVELSFVNNSLVLKGERKTSHEVNEKGYHYRETSYGRFERRLALPQGVNPDKISAKFENGVLQISMPMPESATGKKVPIQIEGSQNNTKQIKAA